jgi:tyrosine-specific transport protein
MMKGDTKRFILAIATLVGTVIGVGIFGVPYAMSQVGLAIAILYVVVLGSIQILQSLFYAEAAMAVEEKIRLVGLARKFLGKKAGHLAAAAAVLGFWGGLIAYILVGGTFLHVLLSPFIGGELFHYQAVWGIIGAAIIYFGLGFVEKIDFISTVLLGVALLLIVGFAAPHVRLDSFMAYIPNADLFLPYGVILFSLSGLSAIPEMEDVMKGKHKGFRKAIIIGMLIAISLTVLFGLAVYGVSGSGTTEDAISGLQMIIGGWISSFAAMFGFLAVATSYFVIGLNLRSTFEYDYKMHVVPAWLLAVGVPLAVVLLGAKDFITIVGFSGAVFGGVTAVMVAMLYIAVSKKDLLKSKRLGVPLLWANITIVVMSLGALYEMFSTLKEFI